MNPRPPSEIQQIKAEPTRREYPRLPQVGVGAIVVRNGRVLLVQRGQPPSEGPWAIPGGRVELGETLQQAAEREILEETGITIRAGDPVYTFDVVLRDDAGRVQFHYVIVDLAADYVNGEPHAGDDALQVRWLSAAEVERLPVYEVTLDLLKKMTNLWKTGK